MNKLISTDKYYLLVYETNTDAIVDTDIIAAEKATNARVLVAFYSNKLNCRVWYSEPGDVFMVLEKSGDLLKVLHGNRVGWIYSHKWLAFKKVKT